MVKLIMLFLIKKVAMLTKRLLKITLCELLWGCMIVLILYLLFWKCNSEDVGVEESLSTNPVILWWSEGFPGTSMTRQCPNNLKCDIHSNKQLSKYQKCDAYLFYGSNINFDNLPLPRAPRDIIWGLFHEESPRNSEELLHEPLLNIFNFSSTYSRHSDVPFPLQYLNSFEDIKSKKFFVQTNKKNDHLNSIAPILYLQSDCETSSERDVYVKELMKIAPVDSYGACLNNKELPPKFKKDYLNHLHEDDFLHFIARYKFVIAIENGVCEDYVTEKFWRAIKVGTVPIYFGSPSIKDWLPNGMSAILLQDFPSPKILMEHINELLEDDEMYEQYLEHKTKELITNRRLIDEYEIRSYQLDVLETVVQFECFICQKVFDKRKGILEEHVVTKSHYNCPKPLSALTLGVNPNNDWLYSWEMKRQRSLEIYKTVMGT